MWPEHGGERGHGLKIADLHVGGKQKSKQRAEVDGAAALEHVEQKGGRAQARAAGAKNVGGADVPAADGTDILVAEQAHQHVAHRNGAKQIAEDAHKQDGKHHDESEFNTTCGGVDARYSLAGGLCFPTLRGKSAWMGHKGTCDDMSTAQIRNYSYDRIMSTCLYFRTSKGHKIK